MHNTSVPFWRYGLKKILTKIRASNRTSSVLIQAEVAQSVEQWTENPRVGSSILSLGTPKTPYVQGVSHFWLAPFSATSQAFFQALSKRLIWSSPLRLGKTYGNIICPCLRASHWHQYLFLKWYLQPIDLFRIKNHTKF